MKQRSCCTKACAVLLAYSVAVCAADKPAFVATAPPPPFSIQRSATGWWLVNPQGQPFFSLGVCVVTGGAAREAYDPENPEYAAWQHYGSPAAWAQSTLERLKAWKFTTIGAWSDFPVLRESSGQTLYLTPVLHTGSSAGAPWWDMWDPKVIARMESVARERILPLRDDPRLLGYYTDNEMGWWNAALWKMTFEHAPSSGQRKRLIQLLRRTYQNDWKRLLRDFEPENASNWRELERRGMLYRKPGGSGLKVMREFLGLMAERYYQLTHDIIRKYDQRALILGDRYQSFFYPEVARAAGRWVDAVSSNLNAHWNDGAFLRCYLETLHQLTGKPILVSEVYLAATENRTGNQNNQGVFPVAGTQAERAAAIRNTIDHLVRTPFVLGADWFQFFDEPRYGRDDGENFNFGLVDIHDRPYEELTAVFAAFDGVGGKNRAEPSPGDASIRGVPRAPADPFEDFQPTKALKHWDRERGFVQPSSAYPLADLYLCWASDGLYLGLYALDVTEDALYRDRSVPKIDRARWMVKVRGKESLAAHVRLGAGRDAIPGDPSIPLRCLSGVNLTVRSITAMKLAASKLGYGSLKAGDTVELESTFSGHCEGYRVEWRGAFTLRD